jgi:ABC-type lipoprotein release transport system permease subunit
MENETTRFADKIIRGASFSRAPSNEAILGVGLAGVLEAECGDDIVVVSQAADGSIANERYSIVGILETGDDMNDRTAFYLHLNAAQELFALGEQIHELAITVHDLDRVGETAEKIRSAIASDELEVAPWQVFARSFYEAMKADKQGMWIMLFVIILIVAVGVLNTVLMSVLERRREYGLLRAIGTKPVQIFSLVLLEVNFLALSSIVIGAALGMTANHWLSVHGLSLPQSFSYGGMEFNTMYAEINLRSLFLPALTVLLSASVISVFPALKASRTKPARAMRIY